MNIERIRKVLVLCIAELEEIDTTVAGRESQALSEARAALEELKGEPNDSPGSALS